MAMRIKEIKYLRKLQWKLRSQISKNFLKDLFNKSSNIKRKKREIKRKRIRNIKIFKRRLFNK